MIRTTILLALVLGLPLGAAMAQTQTSSPTCGPETWSTDKMAYVAQPCGTVGAAGPTVYGSNSTTMTKAEMKQGGYATPTPAAAPGPAFAASESCGPTNTVFITDEFGRKYNCRGDRIR